MEKSIPVFLKLFLLFSRFPISTIGLRNGPADLTRPAPRHRAVSGSLGSWDESDKKKKGEFRFLL